MTSIESLRFDLSSRRLHGYTYYDTGPQTGYLHQDIIDAPNFALTTTYEYDPLGRTVRRIDPRGHDALYTYNELDQVVREALREVADGGGVRYERDTFYDPNDNVVRMDIQNKDETGTLLPNTHFTTIYEYDILNYRTRTCEESGDFPVPAGQFTCAGLPPAEFITTEYEYDANRNRTRVRYGEAVEGRQPTNVTEMLYDERDLTFRETRALGEPGPGGQSTTQYDYDGNLNRIRTTQGLEGADPRVTESIYDGYDRRVRGSDPMGNAMTYTYDANSNRVASRTEGELLDVEGDMGNVRLSEVDYVYDPMDRLTRTDVHHFDTQIQAPIGDGLSTTTTVYSDDSQVLSTTDDNGHTSASSYDTANRRSVVTDAKGNSATYAYDDNSNVVSTSWVEKSDLGRPDERFTTTYAYDNLDRLVRTVDNVGNTHAFGYDSRDNRTRTIDALGNQTRYTYDGLNRLVETVRTLDPPGNCQFCKNYGVPSIDRITTAQAWDDNSRLTAQRDDNFNETRYAYDALDRLIVTRMPDGTLHQVGQGATWSWDEALPDMSAFKSGYDVHGNALLTKDANGSVVHSTFDLLNRVTRKDVERASIAGNCPDEVLGTTFENFSYDGLSRLTRAEDDDSLVGREYDSLSNVTKEVQNQIPPFVVADDRVVLSTFDGEGNKLTCTYPGGRVITYAYDDLDRKKTITDTTDAPQPVARYDYVGPGRVQRRDYGNGTRTEYTYDGITGVANPPNDFGVQRIIGTRHTRISGGTVIDERTFTWDRMYNKTRRKDIRAGGPGLTHDYTYDSVYRLTRTMVTDVIGGTLRDTTYRLDGVHNRCEVVGNPDSGEYVGEYRLDPTECNAGNCNVNQYNSTPFDRRKYDANGNLLAMSSAVVPPPMEADPTDLATAYKNRYLSFSAPAAGAVEEAIRVRMVSLGGFAVPQPPYRWVGEPMEYADEGLGTFIAAPLECDEPSASDFRDWSAFDLINVFGAEIVPGSEYEVQRVDISCSSLADESCYSVPLTVSTGQWGDVVAPFASPGGAAQPDFGDIAAEVDKFQGLPTAPTKTRAQLARNGVRPDLPVDFSDIASDVDAFTGAAFPFSGPPTCGSSLASLAPPPAAIVYDYRNQMVEFNDLETGQRHTYAYDALGRRIAKVVNADAVGASSADTSGPSRDREPSRDRKGAVSDPSRDRDPTRAYDPSRAQDPSRARKGAVSDSTRDREGAVSSAPPPIRSSPLAGQPPSETRFFYDAWQVVEERDASKNTLATYVYGLYIDEVLNMRRDTDPAATGPEDFFYHTDDLYNVMAVTDSAGAVVERHEYQDYGLASFLDADSCDLSCPMDVNGDGAIDEADQAELAARWMFSCASDDHLCACLDADDSGVINAADLAALTAAWGACPPAGGGAVGNPYLFTGRRFDPETEWYYYRTRYLDPSPGRFTTPDTIGTWGDHGNVGNRYTYIANTPTSVLDPLGMGGAPIAVPFGFDESGGGPCEPLALCCCTIRAISGVVDVRAGRTAKWEEAKPKMRLCDPAEIATSYQAFVTLLCDDGKTYVIPHLTQGPICEWVNAETEKPRWVRIKFGGPKIIIKENDIRTDMKVATPNPTTSVSG